MDTNETLREEMDRWADLLVGLRDEHTNRLPVEYDRLAARYGIQLALTWRRLNALPRPPANTSWVTMSDAGPELHMGQPSAATQPESVSLGEEPHDPADCFMYRGRPHLGPCMNAEAYTRWYWTEGPGAEPLAASEIAKATQRLVREAYAAREQRQLWLRRADERAREHGLDSDV